VASADEVVEIEDGEDSVDEAVVVIEEVAVALVGEVCENIPRL